MPNQLNTTTPETPVAQNNLSAIPEEIQELDKLLQSLSQEIEENPHLVTTTQEIKTVPTTQNNNNITPPISPLSKENSEKQLANSNNIENIIPTTNSRKANKIPKLLLTILFIIGISLFAITTYSVVSTIIEMNRKNYDYKYPSIAFTDKNHFAYAVSIQDISDTFTKKTTFGSTSSIGPWSADGKYLPVVARTSNQEENSLLFYNSNTDKTLLTKEKVLSKAEDTLIINPYWKNNEEYFFDLNLNAELETIAFKAYNLTSSTTNTGETPDSKAFANKDVKTQISTLTSTQIVTLANGKSITLPIKENVLGVSGNYLITIELPQITSTSEVALNNELYINATNEEDKKAQMTNFLFEVNRPILHKYNTSDLSKKTDSIININTGWTNLGAQIIAPENLLLLHQKYETSNGYLNKISEINLDKLTEFNTTVSYYSRLDTNITTDGSNSFFISADYKWILFPNQIESNETEYISIFALNRSSKSLVTLCNSECIDLQVYNPDTLTQRAP
jgi:hypothetical protein